MTTTVEAVVETPAAAERTWLFTGHWDDDNLIHIDGIISIPDSVDPSTIPDSRPDDSDVTCPGYSDGGLWADHGTGPTLALAQARAVAPYEVEHVWFDHDWEQMTGMRPTSAQEGAAREALVAAACEQGRSVFEPALITAAIRSVLDR